MYKKLMYMANNPSPYSKYTNIPKCFPSLGKLRFNYSKIEKDNNIYNENESFLRDFFPKNLYIQQNSSKTKWIWKLLEKQYI